MVQCNQQWNSCPNHWSLLSVLPNTLTDKKTEILWIIFYLYLFLQMELQNLYKYQTEEIWLS